MKLLVLIGVLWGLSALIRSRRESRRQREAQRRQVEQQQLAREMREERQRRAGETAARLAIEAEQMRQRRELERQRNEQERLAREQERQAAQLARHEEQLTRLEQQVSLAEREIAHYQPIVDQLRAEAEGLAHKVEYYERRGLPCSGYKTQLERVNEKLYRMETKVIKAENTKQNAQRKLSA